MRNVIEVCVCQVFTAGGEEEARGSYCAAGRGAGRGAGQHGDAQRSLQKVQHAGRQTVNSSSNQAGSANVTRVQCKHSSLSFSSSFSKILNIRAPSPVYSLSLLHLHVSFFRSKAWTLSLPQSATLHRRVRTPDSRWNGRTRSCIVC